MKISKKVLNTEFAGSSQSVNYGLVPGTRINEMRYMCDFGPTQFEEVRRAIAYIVDRDEINKQLTGGYRDNGVDLARLKTFVVCDEAVSALDVSIQSQIVNLLKDLGSEDNLAYLFISHGLSVVKYISDRIGVMYLGNIVELAESQEMFDHPTHPYTEALLSAIPTTDVDSNREMIPLEGDIPSPVHPPKGCKFHTRCKYCTEICKHITPELVEMRPGHFVACHNPLGVEKDS